jgi:hypothetical protein
MPMKAHENDVMFNVLAITVLIKNYPGKPLFYNKIIYCYF